MRITIEIDSESGSATPVVSTVDQSQGVFGGVAQVSAGAAPGAGGGTAGADAIGTAGVAVNAGAAPGAGGGTAGADAIGAARVAVNAGATPALPSKKG